MFSFGKTRCGGVGAGKPVLVIAEATNEGRRVFGLSIDWVRGEVSVFNIHLCTPAFVSSRGRNLLVYIFVTER